MNKFIAKLLLFTLLSNLILFTSIGYAEKAKTGEVQISGNTSSNIKNGGYVLENNNLIYYCDENGIYEFNKNTNSDKKIVSTDREPGCLNLYKNSIYFSEPASDYRSCCLYRLKLDDNTIEKLDLNISLNFDQNSNVHVVNGNIYYINNNRNLIKYNIDNDSKKNLIDDLCNKFFIHNDKIYYINDSDLVNYIHYNKLFKETTIEKCGALYETDIYGSTNRKVCNAATDDFVVNGEWIYFANLTDGIDIAAEGDSWRIGKLYKVNIKTGEIIKVSEMGMSKNLNTYDNYIYFGDAEYIYKLNIDSNETYNLFECAYANEINILGGNIYLKDVPEMPKKYKYTYELGNSYFKIYLISNI